MNKQTVLKIAAGLLVGLLALPVLAQTVPAITVNVPFGFRMGDNSYPAGEYGFTTIHEDVLVLSKEGRTNQGIALTSRIASQRQDNLRAEVRFQCYAGECFVAQVWIPGRDGGFALRQSKAQQQLAARNTGQYMALLATAKR